MLLDKPWGYLGWLLPLLGITDWSLLGCINPEDRCLATFNQMEQLDDLPLTRMLSIKDPPSYYSEAWERETNRNIDEFRLHGGQLNNIERHELFERNYLLVNSVEAFSRESTTNMVLDISTLPKKFFFGIIRLLLKDLHIQNLIVTYTVPEHYSKEKLAEDPQPCNTLPLFLPIARERESLNTQIIVGIGFEHFMLPELLGRYDLEELSVKLMLAFPSLPEAYHRSLEFIREIQDVIPESARKPTIVDAYNVPDTYDVIDLNSDGNIILAPYGPKTMSLAMCLYAINHDECTEVVYSQPTVYNPHYSRGIGSSHYGDIFTFAYCLRYQGIDLYS